MPFSQWIRRVRLHAPASTDGPLAAFYLALISCTLALSIYIPRLVGNVLVLGAYGVFFVAAVASRTDFRAQLRSRSLPALPFRYHPAILVPVVVLWALFVIGFVLNPSLRAFLRLSAFVVISGLTLFVVPAVVTREQAFAAIGVVGAAVVVLGLPSALTDTPFRIAGVVLSTTSGAPIETLGVVLHSPTAFFTTQNYFRVLVAIGTVASAGAFAQTRSPWLALACALNAFGVYLTLGRAARLATIVAAGLAAVYLLAGRRALAGVTALGMFATVVAFASALGIVPTIGPAETLRSALAARLGYWSAAYEAIAVRPFVGWGLVDTPAVIGDRYAGSFTGVHNSYLRLFLTSGIIGGVAYLALAGAALVVAFREVAARTPLALTAFCLVVMALFFQLFAGATIFGTSLSSVLWALTVGYTQPRPSPH